MAFRVAGVAYLFVSGTQPAQYPLRGNFTVSFSGIDRTGIAGQDGIHGYSELPRVPYIEGDITLDPRLNAEDVENITNATVTAELANGHRYILKEAWCTARLDLNAHDGLMRVRWEGTSCVEDFVGVNPPPSLPGGAQIA
jgi:Phage tail tube protein